MRRSMAAAAAALGAPPEAQSSWRNRLWRTCRDIRIQTNCNSKFKSCNDKKAAREQSWHITHTRPEGPRGLRATATTHRATLHPLQTFISRHAQKQALRGRLRRTGFEYATAAESTKVMARAPQASKVRATTQPNVPAPARAAIARFHSVPCYLTTLPEKIGEHVKNEGSLLQPAGGEHLAVRSGAFICSLCRRVFI